MHNSTVTHTHASCWNDIVVHSEKQLAVIAGYVCCWKVPWVAIPFGLSHKERLQWENSGDKWMGLWSGAALLCECCNCWMVSTSTTRFRCAFTLQNTKLELDLDSLTLRFWVICEGLNQSERLNNCILPQDDVTVTVCTNYMCSDTLESKLVILRLIGY